MADGSVSTRFSVEDGASGPLEDIAVEAERVAAELEQAEAQTSAANAALRVQKRAAEDAAFALKELSLSGKATKDQITAAKQASLDAAKALLTARRAADDANAGLKAVQAQAKGLAVQAAAAGNAAGDAAKQIAATGKAASSAKAPTVLEAAALADLASKGFEAAKAIIGTAQAVADLRNDLADASTRSGVAAQTLAGLRLAAEGSGLSFADFGESLNQLPKRISDTARGTGEAIHAFKALDVAVTNTDGSLRSADAVFKDALKSIAQIEDPTTRAAAATSLFGESGGKLLQALGDPSRLDEFVATAERFGVDIGPAAAQSAGDWQRSSALLWTQIDGLKASLVDFLSVGDGMRSLNLGLAATVATFGEQIAAAREVVYSLTEALLQFAKGNFDGAFSRVTSALSRFAERYTNAGTKGIEAAKAAYNYTEAVNTTTPATAEASGETEKFSHNLGLLTQNSQAAAAAEQARAAFLKQTTGILVSALADEERAVAEAALALAEYRKEQEKTGASGAEVEAAVAALQRRLADASQARAFARGIADASEELDYLLAPVKAAPSAFERFSSSIEGIVPPKVLTDLEKLALVGYDLQAAYAKGSIDAGQFAELSAKLSGATGKAQDAKATERDDKIGAAVGGAVAGSLSQTLAPLLDALGPKGMIVSVILGILEQGPEAVKAILLGVPKILGDLVGTVLDLIPQLPQILTDVIMGIVKVLPDLLLAVFSLVYGPFAVELSIALVKLIPMLVKELTLGLAQLAFQLPSILFDTAGAFGVLLRELRDLPRILIRQATRDLIPALVDGIAKAFRQIVRDAVRTFSLDGRRERRSGGTDDGRRLVDILDRQRARRSRRASG